MNQLSQDAINVVFGSQVKVLNIHKRQFHSSQDSAIVIKKNLNLIKGEAGGLSDHESNQKRGQADNICNQIVNDILKSMVLEKRDIKSTKPGSNGQDLKKESTKVDIKLGSNFQETKKYLPIVIKKIPEPHQR